MRESKCFPPWIIYLRRYWVWEDWRRRRIVKLTQTPASVTAYRARFPNHSYCIVNLRGRYSLESFITFWEARNAIYINLLSILPREVNWIWKVPSAWMVDGGWDISPHTPLVKESDALGSLTVKCAGSPPLPAAQTAGLEMRFLNKHAPPGFPGLCSALGEGGAWRSRAGREAAVSPESETQRSPRRACCLPGLPPARRRVREVSLCVPAFLPGGEGAGLGPAGRSPVSRRGGGAERNPSGFVLECDAVVTTVRPPPMEYIWLLL